MQYNLRSYILIIHGNTLSGLHNRLVLIESCASLDLQFHDEDRLCRQHKRHWKSKSYQAPHQGAAQADGSLKLGTGTLWGFPGPISPLSQKRGNEGGHWE